MIFCSQNSIFTFFISKIFMLYLNDFNVCNKCTDKIDERLSEEYKGTRGMEFLKEMTSLYIEGGLPINKVSKED